MDYLLAVIVRSVVGEINLDRSDVKLREKSWYSSSRFSGSSARHVPSEEFVVYVQVDHDGVWPYKASSPSAFGSLSSRTPSSSRRFDMHANTFIHSMGGAS